MECLPFFLKKIEVNAPPLRLFNIFLKFLLLGKFHELGEHNAQNSEK